MPNEHDIPGLSKKITALSKALANLSSEEDFKELIRIIRFPGWMTPRNTSPCRRSWTR